jgi:hypothetical protein
MPDAPVIPDFNDYMLESERTRIRNDMEAATVIGDSKRVLALSDQLATLEKNYGTKKAATTTEPKPGALIGVEWTVNDAQAALSKIADWFGSDPKLTKAAREAADFIDVKKFPKVEDYVAKIKEVVEKEHNVGQQPDPDDEEEEEEIPEDDEEEEPPPARKSAVRRAAPTGGVQPGTSRATGTPGRSKLSDITNKADRNRLKGMIEKHRLDPAVVVKNYFTQKDKEKKAARK